MTTAQLLGLKVANVEEEASTPVEDMWEDAPEGTTKVASKHHHAPAVEVETRDGKKTVCPHCMEELTEESTYTDAKGWSFCRPCFRKGRGAVRIDKKASAPFLFEYELPPDEEEFDMEKVAQSTASFPVSRPVWHGARSPQEALAKRNVALATSGAYGDGVEVPSIPPAIALPALGTAAGAVIGDEEEEGGSRVRGALKGLLTGAGAAGGEALAHHAAGPDLGGRVLGAAGGGTLAYLLSKALLNGV
jgi:hypothetical protein